MLPAATRQPYTHHIPECHQNPSICANDQQELDETPQNDFVASCHMPLVSIQDPPVNLIDLDVYHSQLAHRDSQSSSRVDSHKPHRQIDQLDLGNFAPVMSTPPFLLALSAFSGFSLLTLLTLTHKHSHFTISQLCPSNTSGST
ncbi:unnamed protein product [Protopolystoma xenopodis]|uniref:Uncharacterized protein n=1 Tax=Protopolystoma xenopodis TaxID=117903 RepID=A0A3S5AYG3_9PLAT|nr:unnamed protein product [Protopolystoma xenopodis]